jgi:hypothetical protein
MNQSHGVRTLIIACLMLLTMVSGVVYVPYIARAQTRHLTDGSEVSTIITELIKAHNRDGPTLDSPLCSATLSSRRLPGSTPKTWHSTRR